MITTINEYKLNLIYRNAISNLYDNCINENNIVATDEREEVIQLLDENDLETTPKEFYDSYNKSKHQLMMSHYSIDELSKFRLFKVPGYNIGYALHKTDDGTDIILVHNNEPTVKGIGADLIESAKRNGGNKLDHFDIEPLTTIYSNAGFKEYDRYKYDPQYDENGEFRKKYGEKDVVYRKL